MKDALLINKANISITKVITEKMKEADYTGATYNIHLKLSEIPNHKWKEIFSKQNRSRVFSLWRKGSIKDNEITLKSNTRELQGYYIDIFKDDVRKANNKYKEYVKNLAQIPNSGMNYDKEDNDVRINYKTISLGSRL
jgi:hypothetical protein